MVRPRVVVFIDYENAYRNARESFHERWDPYTAGQFDPVRLSQLVTDRGLERRHLKQVRIYRGRPNATFQPAAHAANLKQTAVWIRSPFTYITARALRYPYGWPDKCPPGLKPQEKGIDVALAIDPVMMAEYDEYDTAVVVSSDTDLKPALEAVVELAKHKNTGQTVEIAAWNPPPPLRRRRLSIKTKNLWCHWLDKKDYRAVADETDYTL